MLKPLDYEKLIQFHIGYNDSLLTNKDSSRYGAWNAEQVTGKSPDNLGDRLLNSVFAKSVKLFICYLFLLIYLKQPKSPLQLIIPIRLLEIAHANVKRTRRRNKLSFLNFLSLLSAIYLTPSTGPFTSERCSAFNHSISNLLLWKSFSFLNSLYLHFASTFTKPWSRVFTVLLPFIFLSLFPTLSEQNFSNCRAFCLPILKLSRLQAITVRFSFSDVFF